MGASTPANRGVVNNRDSVRFFMSRDFQGEFPSVVNSKEQLWVGGTIVEIAISAETNRRHGRFQ